MRSAIRPGFTLIELLVAMGTSAIVLVVISIFMVNLSASTARQRTALELQSTGRLILNRVSQSLRTAAAAPIVVSPTTVQIPTGAGNVTYALVGTDLIETLPAGTSGSLNGSTIIVQNFSVVDETVGIQVHLTLGPQVATSPAVLPETFTTTIVPRTALYD